MKYITFFIALFLSMPKIDALLNSGRFIQGEALKLDVHSINIVLTSEQLTVYANGLPIQSFQNKDNLNHFLVESITPRGISLKAYNTTLPATIFDCDIFLNPEKMVCVFFNQNLSVPFANDEVISSMSYDKNNEMTILTTNKGRHLLKPGHPLSFIKH